MKMEEMRLLCRFTRFCQHFHAILESFGYFLLIMTGGLGCSQHQPTISPADLRAQLHPLKTIETYAGFDAAKDLLYFGNRFVERQLYVNKDRKPIRTIGYVYKASRQNYVHLPSEEFRFRVGEIEFSGNSELLSYDSYQIEQRPGGGRRVLVQLTYLANAGDFSSSDATPTDQATPIFHLQLHYEIYADLPVIRKWFTIRNLTESAFFLEDVAIESLSFFAAEDANLQIWENPSDMLSIPWTGGASAESVILREVTEDKGVVLGNAAPGVLKNYQIYSDREAASMGLTPMSALNGVEIRVPPKQKVSSPKVWTMLFDGDLDAIDKTISHVTGKLTSTSISSIAWVQMSPTQHLPSADLMAVDYDWDSENMEVLKQVSQQVHNSGSKFGIRLPIAELSTDFLDRPGWRLAPIPVAYTEDGKRVQSEPNKGDNRVTYCVLSDYGYYLPQAIRILLEETSADLLIFDRPIINAPDSPLTGCDAYGHEHYRRAESVGLIYRWVFEFADYLHQEYPALKLGITSAAYGIEKPDSACLAHFDLFFHE